MIVDRRVLPAALLTGLVLLIGAQAYAAPPSWVVTSTRAYTDHTAAFKRYLGPTESLHIVVGLRLRNADNLHKYISSQLGDGSTTPGNWLTSTQVAASYLPTKAQAQLVAAYLERNGFTEIQISANRLLVSANGTAATVLAAFKTRLAYYSRAGHEGIVNLSDVQVPASLGNTVQSILGLQTLDQMQVLAGVLYPLQFQIAYDSALPAATSTPVAIVTEGNMSPTISDLHTFESDWGLPTINPIVVNVNGSSADTSNELEWNLDSQVIQAAAGGSVSSMTFYTATSLSDAELTATFNRAVSDKTAKVINVSLGECETTAKNDGSMAQDDSIFALAVAQGQTFSVASGDSGSNQCGSGGVSYPASSQYVIAVGGTTLSTYPGSAIYSGETAWGGSGGGPSAYEVQPSWQNDVVPGTHRGVPDVAFDADPNTGAYVILNGVVKSVGGTSLASPLFVGSWARIISMPGVSTGFPASWIYNYGRSGSDPAFHDVTSGSNGGYTAGVGWDYVTGWGSWDVEGIGCKLSTVKCEGPTMTEGTGALRYGFDKPIGFGSMNPSTTSNGYTYQELEDDYAPRGGGYVGSSLQVSGLSTDPGQSWLLAVGCYDGVLLGSTASYSYSGGVATWSWAEGARNQTGFGFTGSGAVACHIVHK